MAESAVRETNEVDEMAAEHYRIKDPTIAMFHDDGRGVVYTVQAGTVVELSNGPLDGDKLVEVIWDGKAVLMFTQDLRLRAQRID
jgi:hypothetical protein